MTLVLLVNTATTARQIVWECPSDRPWEAERMRDRYASEDTETDHCYVVSEDYEVRNLR